MIINDKQIMKRRIKTDTEWKRISLSIKYSIPHIIFLFLKKKKEPQNGIVIKDVTKECTRKTFSILYIKTTSLEFKFQWIHEKKENLLMRIGTGEAHRWWTYKEKIIKSLKNIVDGKFLCGNTSDVDLC